MVFRSNENESPVSGPLKLRDTGRNDSRSTLAAPISRWSHGERGNDGSRYGSRHRGHRPRAAHVQEIADAEEAGGAVVRLPRPAMRRDLFSSHMGEVSLAIPPGRPGARVSSPNPSGAIFDATRSPNDSRPIGVIARADRTRFIAPAPAWTRRAKYAKDSADERKLKGFELVRVHHQTLTRMFCDDPDGDFLDIDDIRCVWEEFVDALRDASAKAGDPRPRASSPSYADVEQPALQRSPSFRQAGGGSKLRGLGGLTRAPPRSTACRGTGMILGVGCSSRDNSARGGSEYLRGMCKATTLRGSSAHRRARGAAPEGGAPRRIPSGAASRLRLGSSLCSTLVRSRCPFFNAKKL